MRWEIFAVLAGFGMGVCATLTVQTFGWPSPGWWVAGGLAAVLFVLVRALDAMFRR